MCSGLGEAKKQGNAAEDKLLSVQYFARVRCVSLLFFSRLFNDK
jgi:hypothetical protein